MEIIRIITRKEATELIAYLRKKGYGVTNIEAKGGPGPVNVIYMIAKRTYVKDIISSIQKFNPKAFYTIEDVRSASRGVFPDRNFRNNNIIT